MPSVRIAAAPPRGCLDFTSLVMRKGRSCGSTSRAVVHETIDEAVPERVEVRSRRWTPGIPADPSTTMGAIISKVQHDRVPGDIGSAEQEGDRLLTGCSPAAGGRAIRRSSASSRKDHQSDLSRR